MVTATAFKSIPFHFREPNEIKYVSQVEELRQKFSDITRERRALEAEVSDTTKAGR